MEISNALKNVFLFNTFSNDQITQLASFVSIRNAAKGELIFSQGTLASAFFAIISGKLKIFKMSPEGDEQILEIHGPGNLVAEAAIFDKEVYPAYCQAMETSVLVRIPKIEFTAMIIDNPEIALRIMHAYSKRLRYFVSLVEDLSLRDIKTRLAKYILDNTIINNNRRVCVLPISKKELASLLGTIPETLSRAFRSLKNKKIIREEDNLMEVLNISALRNMI